MENKNKKYYSVKIKKFPREEIDYTKPFADLDALENTIQVYAEESKNGLIEILTGKQIQFGVLLEGILPGIAKREIPITEVSMYLKFLTEDAKRKELDKINNCLKSTKEEIDRQRADFEISLENYREEINKGRK